MQRITTFPLPPLPFRSKRSVIASNLLDRQFTASAPNQKWVADFTYVATGEGWLFLAVVLDLYSRMVIGWSMQKDMSTQLVTDAMTMALWRRRPDTAALMHHSDQGTQYACDLYQKLLEDNGIKCSMSRAGNVWDNSAMESFFSSLKSERVHRSRYRTRDEARADIFNYIERLLQPCRRTSRPRHRRSNSNVEYLWRTLFSYFFAVSPLGLRQCAVIVVVRTLFSYLKTLLKSNRPDSLSACICCSMEE